MDAQQYRKGIGKMRKYNVWGFGLLLLFVVFGCKSASSPCLQEGYDDLRFVTMLLEHEFGSYDADALRIWPPQVVYCSETEATNAIYTMFSHRAPEGFWTADRERLDWMAFSVRSGWAGMFRVIQTREMQLGPMYAFVRFYPECSPDCAGGFFYRYDLVYLLGDGTVDVVQWDLELRFEPSYSD